MDGLLVVLFLVLATRQSVNTFRVDGESQLNVSEIIKYYKYPVERHFVKTQDGYTIEMQRIPYGRDRRNIEGCQYRRPAVFFMHGLFGTAHEFVANPATEAPAFIFADAGFDVWLANIRGTIYGAKHDTLEFDEPQFWNFSLNEHADIDLPTQINYVLNATSQKSLYYIGHSEGTTTMFALLSEADETWQKKIRTFYAWGPTAGFMTKINNKLFDLLTSHRLQLLARFIFNDQFLTSIGPSPGFQKSVVSFCTLPVASSLCERFLEYISGNEVDGQFNTTRMSVYLSGISYTSFRNAIHFLQLFESHKLQKYNFGEHQNLEVYGTRDPPVFNIGNIIAPTVLYFSGDDLLTTSNDVRSVILKNMGPGLKRYAELDHFTHFDYAFGLRANEEVYKPMILEMHQDLRTNGCW